MTITDRTHRLKDTCEAIPMQDQNQEDYLLNDENDEDLARKCQKAR